MASIVSDLEVFFPLTLWLFKLKCICKWFVKWRNDGRDWRIAFSADRSEMGWETSGRSELMVGRGSSLGEDFGGGTGCAWWEEQEGTFLCRQTLKTVGPLFNSHNYCSKGKPQRNRHKSNLTWRYVHSHRVERKRRNINCQWEEKTSLSIDQLLMSLKFVVFLIF